MASSASHPYTCNTCQVAYRNIDLQKGHMKSDWHRYNLKRRVASLPPISAEIFSEKVLQARAASTAEADKAFFERVCDVCEKTYYSENAFQNHLSSQKHKSKEATQPGHPAAKRADDETTSIVSSTFSLGDPIAPTRGEVDSDAEEEFNQVVEGLQQARIAQQKPSLVKRPAHLQPSEAHETDKVTDDTQRESNSATPVQADDDFVATLEACLFCNLPSQTIDLNIHHMERSHGMFIPEKPYLVNLDGLLQHLHEKVHRQHQCLYCDKIKSTAYGIQTHMRDTGHCKIPYESEAEQLDIGDFYDFRSTYSDAEDDEEPETSDGADGGAKLGARRAMKMMADDGTELAEGEEGDGWETDSSASSLDSDDLTAVPAEGHIHQFERLEKHPHHSRNDPSRRHQADGWHSHGHRHTHAVFHDDYELHLPSGKSVGHRSLNRYFRQNLHNHPTLEERLARLEIEDGESTETGATESTGKSLQRHGKGREVIPRSAAGMMGVTDQQRRTVRKVEQRGRTHEQVDMKKKDWITGKKLNNHKTYYYREKGGG